MGIDSICGPAVWHPDVSTAIRSTVPESARLWERKRATSAANSAVSSDRPATAAAAADPPAAPAGPGATVAATGTFAAPVLQQLIQFVPQQIQSLQQQQPYAAGLGFGPATQAFASPRGELRDVSRSSITRGRGEASSVCGGASRALRPAAAMSQAAIPQRAFTNSWTQEYSDVGTIIWVTRTDVDNLPASFGIWSADTDWARVPELCRVRGHNARRSAAVVPGPAAIPTNAYGYAPA